MKEAILLTDGYKLDHRRQYPENTDLQSMQRMVPSSL